MSRIEMKVQDFRASLVFGSVWASAMTLSWLLYENKSKWVIRMNDQGFLTDLFGRTSLLASPAIVGLVVCNFIDSQT